MNQDWWSCRDFALSRPISRRGVLLGSGMAILGMGLKGSALAELALRTSHENAEGHTLVVIFLRGGVDGLSVIAPYNEDSYFRARPNLALARPNDHRSGRDDRTIDLNGFFGLHPALYPLMPLYDEGSLAFVHAIGSMDESHSHFEAMNTMERGLAASGSGEPSGWLARHLSTRSSPEAALRAVSVGGTMPDSLRGATSALALDSLDDFRLKGNRKFQRTLEGLYSHGEDPLTAAGRQTLKALESLSRGTTGVGWYPDEELAQGLRQVANLVRAKIGLEVACLEKTGWDTHVAQGRGTGILAAQLGDLGRALSAFAKDLGPEMANVTVIAQTEFGRRVNENDGFGTDHGHGGIMFIMGKGLKPGVHGEWPGLQKDRLSGPGDLQVTTDYRNVLAEVLEKRLGNSRWDKVFPGLHPRFPGIFS